MPVTLPAPTTQYRAAIGAAQPVWADAVATRANKAEETAMSGMSGIKASDYRQAGRYAAQDKRRREAAKEIDAAEAAYEAAIDAYDIDEITFAEYKVARDALYDLDPKHRLFT